MRVVLRARWAFAPLALLLIGSALLLAGGAPEAAAHGGNMSGPPKPPEPPPAPNPHPIPPPPPPAQPTTPKLPTPPKITPTPPPMGPGGQGPSTGGPATTPGGKPNQPTPPTTTGPTTGPQQPGGTRPAMPWRDRRKTSSPGTDAWSTWWQHNRTLWMPTRGDGLEGRLGVTTPGAGGTSPVDDWEQRRAVLARSVLTPNLLRLLDPKSRTDDDVRAAALLALARTTESAEHVDLILRHAKDAKAPNLVRETACLALGLVRRDRAPYVLDAVHMDLLRHNLFAVIDDDRTPTRARGFAILSLGLLADQPYATAFSKDGRIVTRLLWERAKMRWSHPELPIAFLTALGMQPRAGVPQTVLDGLQHVALGKHIRGTKFTAAARAHALSSRLRLGGPQVHALLLRVLPSRRMPIAVRQAAWIGVAAAASDFTSKERLAAFEVQRKAYEKISDPLTRGLAFMALARLIETDLEGRDDSALLYQNQGCALLLKEARVATGAARGFAAVALGLAARNAGKPKAGASSPKSRAALAFHGKARALLHEMLTEDARAAQSKGAYALGLGLLRHGGAADAIAEVVRDRNAGALNRRHAAEALALLRTPAKSARDALLFALEDGRAPHVRAGAALALATLARGKDTQVLTTALTKARTHNEVGQVALAVGHLGDLDAVRGLVQLARNKKALDENRALAVAAAGILLDPSDVATLERLRVHANYPARTRTLHEAFDIL